jgi:TRAP-type mannitol/chloroaromatic compound transport system permease small subunit
MTRALFLIDRFSALVGKTFAWLIVVLTFFISYDVITRRFIQPLSLPAWVCAFDWEYMLYGTLFMMAGAYTLSKNGHVRGDVLYGFFRPRTQATWDLILYIVFFLPGVFALTYAGYYYAADSWRIHETSNITAEGPPIYPFKTIIPLAGGILLLQGIVEIIRCVICIKQGYWPSREQDVEEVDVEKLKEELHVKDEDIEKLDVYVTKEKPR